MPDPRILARPDFSNQRLPARSYTFVLIFGVLTIGLAVVGFLDVFAVLPCPENAFGADDWKCIQKRS